MNIVPYTFCIESSFATVFTKQSHHRSRIELLLGVDQAAESSLHTTIPHATGNFLVRKIFKKVLFDLRIIIISRMAKPEEVLMTEDKNGQIIEEKVYEKIIFY